MSRTKTFLFKGSEASRACKHHSPCTWAFKHTEGCEKPPLLHSIYILAWEETLSLNYLWRSSQDILSLLSSDFPWNTVLAELKHVLSLLRKSIVLGRRSVTPHTGLEQIYLIPCLCIYGPETQKLVPQYPCSLLPAVQIVHLSSSELTEDHSSHTGTLQGSY